MPVQLDQVCQRSRPSQNRSHPAHPLRAGSDSGSSLLAQPTSETTALVGQRLDRTNV